jgi:hypothetical protein
VVGVVGMSLFGRTRRKPFKLLSLVEKQQRRWYDVWGAPSEKFTFGPCG